MKRLTAILLYHLRGIKSFIESSVRLCYYRTQGMRIGSGTRIPEIFVTWPHQVLIGKNCTIEHNVFFKFDGPYKNGASIIIGDGSFIGSNVEFNVKEKVELGRHCLIGSGTRFIDHDHGTSLGELIQNQSCPTLPIHLEEDIWVGANALILKGVTIERGAIIAGGAVITKSIGAYEIWAGVPAKKIGVRN